MAVSVSVQAIGKCYGWEVKGAFTGNIHQARILAELETWSGYGYVDASNFIKGYFYIDTTHKQNFNYYIHILLGPKDCGTDLL